MCHTHTYTHMHRYRQWKQVDKLFVAVWLASDSSFGGCVSALLSDMSLRCCLFCVDTHLCAEMGAEVFCVNIKCFPNQLIKNKYKAQHAAFMWRVFRLSYVRAHETKLSEENFHSKNNASTCIYTGWPNLCVFFFDVVGIKRSSWFVFGTVRGFRPSRLRVHWRTLRSRWSSAQRRPTLTWSNRWVKGTYSLPCVTRFMKAMLCQAHGIPVTALASASDCSLTLWHTFWLKSKSPVFGYYADSEEVMFTSFQVARFCGRSNHWS